MPKNPTRVSRIFGLGVAVLAVLGASGCGSAPEEGPEGAFSSVRPLSMPADGLYRIATCERNTDVMKNRATLDLRIVAGQAVALQGEVKLASIHESGTIKVQLNLIEKVLRDAQGQFLFWGQDGVAFTTPDSEGGGQEIARFRKVILGPQTVAFDSAQVFAAVNPGCHVVNRALLEALSQ